MLTPALKGVVDTISRRYEGFCKAAQIEFYDRHWPCEATDSKGNRCVNIKSTHSAKGHQNLNGKIFSAKDRRFKLKFKSSYDTDSDKERACEIFFKMIVEELKLCIQEYKDRIDPEKPNDDGIKKAVAELHMFKLKKFRAGRLMGSLFSHQTCFCCLTSSPAYKLLCGHIICRLCFEDYSEKREEPSFCRVIEKCPLCGSSGPLKFEMKPPTAGLRILCLDG